VELADTSAWTTKHRSAEIEEDFTARLLAGEIATCQVVRMELLWTARSAEDFDELSSDLAALDEAPVDDGVWSRAVEVWRELIGAGRHRQVKWVDLVVAAAAETAGIAVCPYDADFEAIAAITGQPVRAIAPLGTL
jgi:predicted nucleic acid-binding protein